MKTSELYGFVKKALDLGSHAHTIMSVLNALSGRKPSDDAPRIVKGTYGIFGMEDELRFQILLDMLTKKQREIINDYLRWAYPHKNEDGSTQGVMNKLVRIWATNQFRTFVVKLDGDPIKMGRKTSKTTTKNPDGSTKTETLSQDDWRDSKPRAIKFLRTMVSDIVPKVSEYDGLSEEVRGQRFMELQRRFRAEGVPTMPENIEGAYQTILGLYGELKIELVKFHDYLEKKAQASKGRKKGLLERMINR